MTNRTENYFRRVTVQNNKGRNFVLVINIFDLSPEEMREIYKSRWPSNYSLNESNNI
ncbi:hypothetical protein [Macrococcus carouselicus]|uniref:hypothetical protein n=1 Tax=Macrococcus carouselicus TaxID=69969 RepID=UPI001409223A|nr:hypothetical protein [Macrococcus carouselicus]